jgi:hypothetical protein
MNPLQRFLLLGAALTAAASAGTVTFALDPIDGQLFGGAGTSVGWSYTITETNPAEYITIAGFLFFDPTAIGTAFDAGSPSTHINNGVPLTVTWSAGSAGLQYDIFNDQHVPDATRLDIILLYNSFAVADNSDTGGDLVYATPDSLDGKAGVEVNAEYISAVPEPATVLLLGGALTALALLRRRRKV